MFFICSEKSFTPVEYGKVRWLDKDTDYEIARMNWLEWNQVLAQSTWEKAHEYGYRYAGILEEDQIISIASVWQFSENWWEIAAVSTLVNHRRKGYSKSVISFLTAYILESNRLATCSTQDDNIAMISTAKSVGFQEVLQKDVMWSYPKLPDF